MDVPPPLPPPLRNQGKTDADHLQLLAIFHHVAAGLAIVGLGFLLLHFGLMNALLSNPEAWKGSKGTGAPPPAQIIAFFKWFYVFGGIVLSAAAILNVLSGIFISRRKHRTFSIIIAALNCLQVPFGTILGVFTLVVLTRGSVRELYESRKMAPELAGVPQSSR